jgi:hypothetical protein
VPWWDLNRVFGSWASITTAAPSHVVKHLVCRIFLFSQKQFWSTESFITSHGCVQGDRIGRSFFFRLLWAVYFPILEVAQIFRLLFTTAKVPHKFRLKNGLGNILGDFFTKLIWSHWMRATHAKCTSTEILQKYFCCECSETKILFLIKSFTTSEA